ADAAAVVKIRPASASGSTRDDFRIVSFLEWHGCHAAQSNQRILTVKCLRTVNQETRDSRKRVRNRQGRPPGGRCVLPLVAERASDLPRIVLTRRASVESGHRSPATSLVQGLIRPRQNGASMEQQNAIFDPRCTQAVARRDRGRGAYSAAVGACGTAQG